MYIDVDHVSVKYQKKEDEFVALDDVSLQIDKGEFICLLGPSGCGKTTLLNAMAGFEKVTAGSIKIDGKSVEKPNSRYVTIFQHYGLLPWRTVEKNVELGLEEKNLSKEERRKIADKYIDLVKLGEFKHHHPKELSGGMQQRVSIARALAVNPDILFMDEPFAALDAITRMKLQNDVRQLCSDEKKTIVFVTHDIDEAVFLADRIVLLTPNPGKIKSIIPVHLSHVRDRTADEYLLIRDKIFDLMKMKTDRSIEYYI